MLRRNHKPTYRCHTQSGQAIVTLTDGSGGRKDFTLGTYDTPASRTEYDRPGSNGNRGSNWIASGVTTYHPATAAAWLPLTDTRNNACQASSCHAADLSDCNSAVERPDTTMAYGPVAEPPGLASICRSAI